MNVHVNAAVWWHNRWHQRIRLDEHPSEECRQIWRMGNGWCGNQPFVLTVVAAAASTVVAAGAAAGARESYARKSISREAGSHQEANE